MEEGIIARALNYHWPPNSWSQLTIKQLIRICAVEKRLAEEVRQVATATAPPMTGSDTASDDED